MKAIEQLKAGFEKGLQGATRTPDMYEFMRQDARTLRRCMEYAFRQLAELDVPAERRTRPQPLEAAEPQNEDDRNRERVLPIQRDADIPF
ncbi:MAG: hypothetical protein R3B90_11215 [Planctomycetaceae bacterium]